MHTVQDCVEKAPRLLQACKTVHGAVKAVCSMGMEQKFATHAKGSAMIIFFSAFLLNEKRVGGMQIRKQAWLSDKQLGAFFHSQVDGRTLPPLSTHAHGMMPYHLSLLETRERPASPHLSTTREQCGTNDEEIDWRESFLQHLLFVF